MQNVSSAVSSQQPGDIPTFGGVVYGEPNLFLARTGKENPYAPDDTSTKPMCLGPAAELYDSRWHPAMQNGQLHHLTYVVF